MIPPYYEFACPVKVLSGRKALANVPYELQLLGASRPLLIADAGVAKAGLVKRVQAAFEDSAVEIAAVFDRVPPDSSVARVAEAAQLYRRKRCDALLAVGGGSVIDTAKCAGLMLAEDAEDLAPFQGAERLSAPRPPFVVVPTTAGTGSEVSLAAIVHDEARHIKMAFTSYRLLPDVAVLDPAMTRTCPPLITAAAGMDALTHAVEASYSRQRNPVSDAFAASAIQLTVAHLEPCVGRGRDDQARLAMANAALLAGMSFSNAMVGGVHALAHAAGAVSRIAHGVANAILLPHVMTLNLEAAGDVLTRLAPLLGAKAEAKPKAAVDAVVALRQRLHDACGLPRTLEEAGVPEDDLEAIAALSVDDGSALYNPKDFTRDTARAVLAKAYR